MNTLDQVKAARQLLRSTQINWQEECLFDCDDMLTEVIRELESDQPKIEYENKTHLPGNNILPVRKTLGWFACATTGNACVRS
jgi:hypothetical protein